MPAAMTTDKLFTLPVRLPFDGMDVQALMTSLTGQHLRSGRCEAPAALADL